MTYRFLDEDGRSSRRSVADALEVLSGVPDFSNSAAARIRIWPLYESVGLVHVEYNPIPEVTVAVGLHSATGFHCKSRRPGDDRQVFELTALDRAQVTAAGDVFLADGTSLVAVEVTPAPLPWTLSDTEARILFRTILWAGREKDCIRSMRKGVPENLQKGVPDWRWFDFSKVREIRVPQLKTMAIHIQDYGWCDYPRRDGDDGHFKPSLQTIATTYWKCGIREVYRRPRRARPTSA